MAPFLRAAGALAFLVCGAASAQAQVEIRVQGDRVDIEVKGAPLSEVLDRLAQATGMKIVYDDAGRPRRPVIASIHSQTQAQAVLSLLRGSGLGYAVRMDPSGKRIETLLLIKGGAGRPSTAASSGPVAYDEGNDPLRIEEVTPTPTEEPTPSPTPTPAPASLTPGPILFGSTQTPAPTPVETREPEDD